MKIKKILAIILSVVMLSTMSVSAFAETYVVNEFDENYVICNERFSGGEISNNMVAIEGTHEVKDGFVLLRPGATLTADLASDGKSVKDGVVNVAFNFEPNLNGSETKDTATQVFDFGGGFQLEAQWSEYDTPSSWIKDGKFNIGGKELIKFNADGTGGGGVGAFRAIGSENAAPSLYYKINAKINLNTNKINLTIVERETTKVNNEYITTEVEIVNDEIGNNEYDYTGDTFEYFSENLESTGTDRFNSLVSGLNISTEGEASYADVVGGIEEYPDGYVFEDKGASYTSLKNGQSYAGEAKATSGIVDVSYRFWPSKSNYEDGVDVPATQTFDIGGGFSFNAQWTSWGAGWWCINGKFVIGNQTITMNKDGEMGAGAGQFRPKDRNATEAHAYYDISAKINLDTRKINVTIEENLDTASATDVNIILNNAEFDYNAPFFDGFNTSLASNVDYIESYNSNLIIKADGTVSYSDVVTYPDEYIFINEGDGEITLTDGMSKQVRWYVTKGNSKISYRFWPDMSGNSNVTQPAMQTFELGDGFSFNAQWTPWGNAAWIKDGKFTIGGQTITFNKDNELGAAGAGTFRRKGENSAAPHAYYDISAKINLDTQKIKFAIVEYLELKDGTVDKNNLLPETEYDYTADSFDFFRTSLTTNGDIYLQSLNNKLLIQADGEAVYSMTGDVEPEPEFVENKAVTLKNEKGIVNTFAEFNASNSPSVNLKFKNTTGNDINTILIIAYYKNDSIVKIDEIKNVQLDGSYEQVDYNFNFNKANTDADSVKIFVWNDMTDISPIKVSAGIQ